LTHKNILSKNALFHADRLKMPAPLGPVKEPYVSLMNMVSQKEIFVNSKMQKTNGFLKNSKKNIDKQYSTTAPKKLRSKPLRHGKQHAKVHFYIICFLFACLTRLICRSKSPFCSSCAKTYCSNTGTVQE
jgi:hypothetical protein